MLKPAKWKIRLNLGAAKSLPIFIGADEVRLIFIFRAGLACFEGTSIHPSLHLSPFDAIKALIFCEGHFTQPGAYPMLLFAPFAFFPLFSGVFALFALPNYAVLALSDWKAMRELGFQHASLIAPWLAASLPFAFSKLQRLMDEKWQTQWRKVLVATFSLCLVVSFFRYVPHTYQHFHSNIMPKEEAEQIRSFLSEVIPLDASVSAPSQLVPHLAHRKEVYLFPNPFQRAGYGPSPTTLKQLDGRLWVKPLKVKVLHKRMKEKAVEYIVLKAGRQNTWPLKPDYYEQTAIGVLTCESYGVLAVKGDLVVLKRGEDFWLGLMKLGVSMYQLAGQEEGNQRSLEQGIKEAWERLKEGREGNGKWTNILACRLGSWRYWRDFVFNRWDNFSLAGRMVVSFRNALQRS
ncbi:MAG: DUF2079 domain-containing protein [Armatimonadetes bacterium]|nr:DUF2079 domain-containing protein [Armatimonadota bacterium]